MSAAAPERPTLSIVVPARNEGTIIARTLRALRGAIDALVADGIVGSGEVVLVDDGSTDDTAAVALGLAGTTGAAISVVPTTGPNGLGTAVRHGLAAATGDLVFYTDADLPVDPFELGRMIRLLDQYEADLLCGHRLDRIAEGNRRALQTMAYNGLVRALLPVRVRDVNVPCKLIRRPLLDAVLPQLRSDGSFIDAELLARCDRLGAKTIQVAVDYFPRLDSTSSLGGMVAIKGIVRELSQQLGELRRPAP